MQTHRFSKLLAYRMYQFTSCLSSTQCVYFSLHTLQYIIYEVRAGDGEILIVQHGEGAHNGVNLVQLIPLMKWFWQMAKNEQSECSCT